MTAALPRDPALAPGPDARSRTRLPGWWPVVEARIVGMRAFWSSAVIGSVLTPLLYVLALGVGLGTVVNRNGTDTLGVPYLVFVAPAFLVAAAVQGGAGEASYPVMAGFRWMRVFHGMAASPITTRQVADGTLIWIGLRLALNAAIYLVIMTCVGASQRWQVVIAVPIATLCGLAFAAPVAALSATVKSESAAFNVLQRFIVTPMFLFSGTFYPISQLPEWGRWVARVSPLWHGTELARDAAIGGLGAGAVVVHVAYLLAWLVAGVTLARWRFDVRLTE